nr:immunoglobulin light chain junction region [Macaca mulatta]MOW40638.1 immunoglobulin light chain junction region [Macaca mulatta]MOW40708.1 immunoglobulin light chain junction region [Macaca mulatta]MOW40745.1 immunoglobulin light chain junction region [Macaca mulatta]MOW40755.1 immunoglobulin light chain junction region [Macaca mulatta]
CLQGDSPPYSF